MRLDGRERCILHARKEVDERQKPSPRPPLNPGPLAFWLVVACVAIGARRWRDLAVTLGIILSGGAIID